MNTPVLRRKYRRKKANYAFINFLLFAFCIQLIVSSIGNVTKIISYSAKYNELSRYMENSFILNEEFLSDYNCNYETNDVELPLKKMIKLI